MNYFNHIKSCSTICLNERLLLNEMETGTHKTQYLCITANNYPESLNPIPGHPPCLPQGKKDEHKFTKSHNSPWDLTSSSLKWLKPFLILQHFMSKGSCFVLDVFQARQTKPSPIKLLGTMNKHTA